MNDKHLDLKDNTKEVHYITKQQYYIDLLMLSAGTLVLGIMIGIIYQDIVITNAIDQIMEEYINACQASMKPTKEDTIVRGVSLSARTVIPFNT